MAIIAKEQKRNIEAASGGRYRPILKIGNERIDATFAWAVAWCGRRAGKLE